MRSAHAGATPNTVAAAVACAAGSIFISLPVVCIVELMLKIQVWTLYGREQFIKRLSVPRWISTFHQVGDIFTKPLPQDSFSRFRSVLLNLSGSDYMRAKRSGVF